MCTLVDIVLSICFAYGNIDYQLGEWQDAKRWYEGSVRIALVEAPIHPITAAAYYKLGCVESWICG